MQIDWENLDKKELFKLRLKGTIPKFGYISAAKRAKFVQFLIDNEFISYKANFQDLVEMSNNSHPGPKIKGTDRYVSLYEVEHDFTYEVLGQNGQASAYRPAERVGAKGHRLVTDKSHRFLDLGPSPGEPL